MAITATHLESSGDTANQSTAYSTGTVSPPSGTDIVLGVVNLAGYATANDPVISGLSLTWTILQELAYSTHTAYLVLGEGTPDASGTISMDPDNADAATGCAWSFWAFDGVDTTTPIVQSASDANGGVASTTYDVTLASFADATNNVTFVGAAKNGTALPTEEASNGYATAQGGSHATPNVAVGTSWKTGEDTSPSMTGASVVHACFAAEIAAAATGVSGDGAGTIQLSAAADGSVLVQGDGAGTIRLSAAADGSVLVQGDGTGTIQLTAVGDGSVLVQGDGAGTIQLSAAGTGHVGDPEIFGDGAGTIQLSVAADGSVLVQGDGAGTIQLSAAADGSVLVQGDGAGTIQLSAVADGSVLVQGDGAGTIQLGAAGDGSVLVQGDGTGTIQFTAAGSGGGGVTGVGAGTIELTAVGDGSVLIQGEGAATLAFAIAAAAVVTNPNVEGYRVGGGLMGMPRTGMNRRRRR